MTIHLPLPPRALSPNGRVPWPLKHKAMKWSKERVSESMMTQDAKLGAERLCESLRGQNEGAVKMAMSVDAYPARPGMTPMRPVQLCCPVDDDNGAAACKGYRDAIAEALGVDDRHIRTLWTRKARPREWGVSIHPEGVLIVTVSLNQAN